MASFAEMIVIFIFLIPLYAGLIWSYLHPEDSLLVGKKWMYKEEPEPSPKAIRYTKFTSMMVMIGIPFILLSFLTTNNILRFLPIIIIFAIILGALKILISEDHS
ncbi:hypothetical protein [Ureibacillus sinduriensis]|uniref:hypothetical protein n=1 Tax=Ureibacillus sinduriensis TaxID=561440 RepID=UPI001595C8D4|nr:hypothetical protein [Ureibacillus sinduriensis]